MTEKQKNEFIEELNNVKIFEDYYKVRKKIEICDPMALINVPNSALNSHLKSRDINFSLELELTKYAINNIEPTNATLTSEIKIFISHSSVDAEIGEKFLDALIDLGVNEQNIFYSSRYHTGVKLGKDFHKVVKDALNSSRIVIFLLTRSFYKSAACLNEMGACWMMGKEILPILLDGLTYQDMKGFIDSHYIAYTPNISESFKLKSVLRPFINKELKDKDAEEVFKTFIKEANEMASKNRTLVTEEESELSPIEKMILSGRFTDGELLLINYIYEKQIDHIEDYAEYDFNIGNNVDTQDNIQLKQYADQFVNFNINKAKNSLERSGIIESVYVRGADYQPNYNGFEVDIIYFRDIISLCDECKLILEKTKTKNSKPKNILNTNRNDDDMIQSIITGEDLKEIEGLFYSFIKDTYTDTFGDRWMADHTISEIREWEKQNDLNNKLSSNYSAVLKILKHREIVEVVETTSYGNPRLFKLKKGFDKQVHNLNSEAKKILNKIIENNKFEEEFPF